MKKRVKKILNGVWNFIACLTDDNVSIYAAQASFFLIISSIPFLMFVFTIMKLFIDVDQDTILHTVNSLAPSKISSFLTIVFNELFDKTASISVISITAVTALWLASRGFMALYMGLKNVYHLPRKNYFYNRLISVVYTLAFVATLIMMIIFLIFGNKLELYLESRATILAGILQFLLRGKIVIFFAYLTIIFALFYKFLPQKSGKFSDFLPGAVFAAAGWMIFSYLYSIYIESYSSYTYVYGSLAAIVFLMLWLYFCMNIFLYGAQINKMIKNGFFKK